MPDALTIAVRSAKSPTSPAFLRRASFPLGWAGYQVQLACSALPSRKPSAVVNAHLSAQARARKRRQIEHEAVSRRGIGYRTMKQTPMAIPKPLWPRVKSADYALNYGGHRLPVVADLIRESFRWSGSSAPDRRLRLSIAMARPPSRRGSKAAQRVDSKDHYTRSTKPQA